ncbi:cadherin repeat domain-containing protein [Candidatus Pacearchaeota archaeon]|nr:cadherin repeat domain-containing protein [Candidatus Pacearchaeota archaeon]
MKWRSIFTLIIILTLIVTIGSSPINIKINKAEHLDENRQFIANIYDYVNETDGITYTIPESQYARAYFERDLTNENFIDIFTDNTAPTTIFFYEKDSDVLVGQIDDVEKGKYFISLNHTGTQSVFDMKSIGTIVTYDYIHDAGPLTDYTHVANDSSIGEVEQITISITYKNEDTGTDITDMEVGLLVGWSGDSETITDTCSAKNSFKVFSVACAVGGGQSCTDNAATITFTDVNKKTDTGSNVFTIESCSGSGANSPYSITSVKVSGTDSSTFDHTLSNIVVLATDNNYPQFSAPTEYPTNDTSYSSSALNYKINSTITFTNSTTGIEFDGTNYSSTNVSDAHSVSIANLAAGIYDYWWWAFGNGTDKKPNSSATRTYSVAKSSDICGVYFNTSSPITFPDTFAVYTNCSTDYTLKQNGTTISNATEVVSGASAFNFSVQRTDTANYSDTYNQEEFQVLKNSDLCGVQFNETSPLEYPGTFLVWSNCSSANYLTKNGTVIENNSEQSLAVGAYNFSTNRTDTSNYSNIYSEREFRIVDTNKPVFTTIPSNVSADYLIANVNADFDATDANLGGFYLNDTSNFTIDYSTGVLTNKTPLFADSYALNVTINDTSLNINWTIFTVVVNKIVSSGSLSGTASITYGTQGNVDGAESNSGDGGVAYKLYRNGTEVSDPDESILTVGFYSYIYNATSGGNYTANASLDTFDLTVNQNPDICGVYFNTSSPITYPDTFIVYTNCSSAYTLRQNGTTISNATTVNSGAGAFNFSVQRTDTANYSNAYSEEEFQVSQDTSICGVEFNETSPLESPGTFLVWSNCSSANYLVRNGTVIANNSEQTLGVGAYNFSTNRTDTSNYSNIYSEREFRIVDTTKPTWSGNQTNTTVAGAFCLFSILYDDNSALNPNGGYIFSTNNSGAWENDSLVMFTSTPEWANVTKTLPANVGNMTHYRWFANDSAGNTNNSDVFEVTTTTADTCTAPESGNWAITCSDNCAWDSDFTVPANITMTGSGTLTWNANMTLTSATWNIFKEDGCEMVINPGGSIR